MVPIPYEKEEAVMQTENSLRFVLLFAPIALATAFLSAVADRFGLWGTIGELGGSWGSMDYFYRHVAKLTPWAPAPMIPVLAWLVNVLEAVLGLFLVFGIQLRMAAWLSAILL